MEIKKYRSISLGKESNDSSITCTKEEYEILKYALELVGVNVLVSSSCGDERTIYFMNEFRSCYGSGFDLDTVKELFERNKKY